MRRVDTLLKCFIDKALGGSSLPLKVALSTYSLQCGENGLIRISLPRLFNWFGTLTVLKFQNFKCCEEPAPEVIV